MAATTLTGTGPERKVVSFLYKQFDPKHYDLFRRTWSGFIAKGNAKRIRQDQLRLLYEANPAGHSFLTIIEFDGAWIGAVSAIATDIILPDRTITKAYQIGDFMVDPIQQGRGLGGLLLRELTTYLSQVRQPVYTFPNTRSIGVFLKQAYKEIRSIPLFAYPLLPAATARRLGLWPKARVREITIIEAGRVADELLDALDGRGSIAKSGPYLHWRYAQMRDQGDYVFSLVDPPGSGPPSVVVWSPFLYRGILIQVVVDVVGDSGCTPALSEVASSGMNKGALAGIHNVEQRRGWTLPPLSIRVPRRFDPRPARLLVPPEDHESETLFSRCLFRTGDWMGF